MRLGLVPDRLESSSGRTPTADAIVIMATREGVIRARPIIQLLGAQSAAIDLDKLKSALNALGKPYSN